MVCCARPAFRMAAIVVVALLAFGRPLSRFLGTAEFMVAAAAVIGAVAAGSALVFAALMSTRRRRAAVGGCVHCQFRCQHAMTGRPSRFWLVTTTDRGMTPLPANPAARTPAAGTLPAGTPAPVLLAMPAVRASGPSWPDRPTVSRPECVPASLRPRATSTP